MVKKREANFECLRVIAMIMIITLHYLSKGDLLPEYIGVKQYGDMLYWLLECICAISVNIFVLISGYFWCEKEWKWKRVISFWFQVIFYSILIPFVLYLVGVLPFDYFNKLLLELFRQCC